MTIKITSINIAFDEQSASPSTPPAGQVLLYAKAADKRLYSRDSLGVDTLLGGSSSSIAYAIVQRSAAIPVYPNAVWTTVVYDTIVADPTSMVTLSGGAVQLSAGTYLLMASVRAYRNSIAFQTRFFNLTSSTPHGARGYEFYNVESAPSFANAWVIPLASTSQIAYQVFSSGATTAFSSSGYAPSAEWVILKVG